MVLSEHSGDVALVDLERTSIHLASKNIIIVSPVDERRQIAPQRPFVDNFGPKHAR